MRNWIIGFWLFLAGFLLAGRVSAQESHAGETPFLFTDRSWALSGDTLWFMTTASGEGFSNGNVVHVRLVAPAGYQAAQVMMATSGGVGAGHLVIPDSLASGVYRLQIFAGPSLRTRESATMTRLLTVYNRFEEEISTLPVPEEMLSISGSAQTDLYFGRNEEKGSPPDRLNDQAVANVIIGLPRNGGEDGFSWKRNEASSFSGNIHIRGGDFRTRDEVQFSVELPEGIEMKEGVVSASIGEDPVTGVVPFYPEASVPSFSGRESFVAVENGFFLEGRVLPEKGELLPDRSLVLLSIPGEPTWFDYCFAGSDGFFRFMLKNAYGMAEVYLRAIAGSGEKLGIELFSNGDSQNSDSVSEFALGPGMTQFVQTMREAAWYEKLFFSGESVVVPHLEIRSRNPLAFYGEPRVRVIPSEFIDLPDFTEISRELLPAVRFRQRGNRYELRIIDDGGREFFGVNPLRLVNGIPVFDNNLLFKLKSRDISYIDLVYRERIFGDLSFKGVVAIGLNEKSTNWLLEDQTLHRFRFDCLQLPSVPGYSRESVNNLPFNMPDMRRVFLFRRVTPGESLHFSFRLSDLKGPVVVKVEGITHRGEPFQMTRKILVR